MAKFFGAVGSLICLTFIAANAWGSTILVPDDYLTIQGAVDAAVSGDIVQIAAGTYSDPVHLPGDGDTTKCCVVLKTGVSLLGAGMGQTIIDGGHAGRGIHCGDADSLTISQLTVTNSFAEMVGPGILVVGCSPKIHHVAANFNFDGGIACSQGANPEITYCEMNNNEAKAGGGIHVDLGCEPLIAFCEINNNEAPFAAGCRVRGDAEFAHCIIDGNHTTAPTGGGAGGVLVIDNAVPTFRFCTISNNNATGQGGGIAFEGDETGGFMYNCLIKDNVGASYSESEAKGGGVSVTANAYPRFYDTVITGNYTDAVWSDGGGVYIEYAQILMQNCTLYNNYTNALDNEAGNMGMKTSTFTETNMVIESTIIAASQAGMGVVVTGGGDAPIFNCVDVFGNTGGDALDGTTGVNNFSLDPMFCDAPNGNFEVDALSPCAPGNHPDGAGVCGDGLIGAKGAGCGQAVDEPTLGKSLVLFGNTPNPFRNGTVISFALPEAKQISLEVFDMTGRQVVQLHDGLLDAGEHAISWNGNTAGGETASSGVYFYRIKADGVTETMRMMRLR
jgi:Right handed beta helix region/FlgD Ig-like domain